MKAVNFWVLIVTGLLLVGCGDDGNGVVDPQTQTYTVTVSSVGAGAAGSGSYSPGVTVSINAGTAPANQRFVKWTTASPGVIFADADSAATSFTMPANAVTVSAVFDSLGSNTNDNFTDTRDGQTYRTVLMPDSRMWMAENLNYAHNSWYNGTNWNTIQYTSTPLASWCYDNNVSYCNIYGRLYTWDAAKIACPHGWRLPTRDDWWALAIAVGGAGDRGTSGGVAGTVLKATSGWVSSLEDIDVNGTDDFGFAALPGGDRFGTDGNYDGIGRWGYWWTATDSTDHSPTDAWRRYIMNNRTSDLLEGSSSKARALSVRCIQNTD